MAADIQTYLAEIEDLLHNVDCVTEHLSERLDPLQERISTVDSSLRYQRLPWRYHGTLRL